VRNLLAGSWLLISLVLPGWSAADEMPGTIADRKALERLIPKANRQVPLLDELSGEVYGVKVTLPRPWLVGGVPCAEELQITDEQWGCTLSKAWTEGRFTSRAGTWASVHYRTGTRAALVLDDLEPAAQSVTLDGIAASTFAHFFASGRLQRTILARAATVGRHSLPAGSEIDLRDDGSLAQAVIHETVVLDGKPIPPGTVEFGTDGAVTAVNEGWFGE
jgi:hypothetical protein